MQGGIYVTSKQGFLCSPLIIKDRHSSAEGRGDFMSLKYEITKLGLENMDGSNNTSVKQMKANCRRFSEWSCEKGYNKLNKILEIGKERVMQEYSNYLIEKELSPATIHTYLAAPCKALDVPMEKIKKPKRTADKITRSRDVSRNEQGRVEMGESRHQRLVEFQGAVGIRRSELAKLKGKNLVVDEAGNLCVEVERGKGGKYQLQRILPCDVEIVKSCFEGIGKDEYVFKSTELRNKIDLHRIRAEHAQKAYTYYCSLDFSEKKKLVNELKMRWLATHPQYEKNSWQYTKWLEQMTKGGGVYVLRGANYDRAIQNNRPTRYNRVALMAVSMFHLSHYRLGVAVVNYLV